MKNISTSTYSFEKLREGGFIYVDKTRQICELLKPETAQIFCARPRRFGKSLMISTLEALFNGRKDLFQGLYIASDEVNYSWETYPVIHLNLADCSASTPERLEAWLKDAVSDLAEENGIVPGDNYPELMFKDFIRRLVKKAGKPAVLLLDEYDKPLTDNIDNPRLTEIRSQLEDFYGVIKGQEKNLRFTFITGVTKFSQVSIFSRLNNLTDISLAADSADMFGYTQEEFTRYFGEYIDQAICSGVISKEGKKLTKEEFLREVKSWYDGFRFYPTAESVYNPVSIGDFFNFHCDFGYYWYATGTSQWLESIARKQPLNLDELENAPIPKSVFSEFNIEDFANNAFGKVDLMKLLYQTGYLTLRQDDRFLYGPDNPYHLCFPNREVEEAYHTLKNI